MNRRDLLIRSAALAAGLAFGLPAVAQTKWDMPTAYPIGNPHTVTLMQLAKDIDLQSNGKLKVVVHPNGSLFKAPEIMRAVESGQAQMGEVLMSLLVNQNQIFWSGLPPLPGDRI